MSWFDGPRRWMERTRLTQAGKQKWWGAVIIAGIVITAVVFIYLGMMR